MAENAARNIGEMLQRADLVTQIQELRQRNAMVRTARIADAAENDEDFDYNGLMGLIFTSINGQRDIKDQTVKVEFLTSAQQLRLPLGLGINLEHEDWSLVPLSATVVNRYRRAYTQSYEQIRTFIEQAGSVRAKRATFDALPLPAADFEFPNWDDRDFWTYGENGRDVAHVANTVIGLFCRLIGLNFDVRDFGFLASRRATVRVTDTQWAGEYENMNDRFIDQLHPYTLSSIAALNYAAVGQWDIGAWVRAYGVGCGVLPHEDTQLIKEWVYVRDVPDTATLNSVMAAQQRLGDKTKSFCLNILAMFGLFHLAKNHTFKKGDANMERIGISYINSLRTMVPPNIIEELKGNQEAAVCTAAHPFGLAQTYWLAQALHNRLGLAVPLSMMLDVTPPPVQRLMIVDAALKEWQNLPISRVLNDLFKDKIKLIVEEIATIKQSPPSFSELHRYYGVENRHCVSEAAKAAADAMMPCVNGFANALHVGDGDRKDGLALAQSLTNVERDYRAMTMAYTSQWKNYMENMDQSGLEHFLLQTYRTTRDFEKTKE